MKFEQNSYFFSDTHFNHANVIKYDDRPFKNIQEHDEAIIQNWNNTVGAKDNVFFLGDFIFGDDRLCAKYWGRLNGYKHFVHGNHDKALQKFCRNEDITLVGYREIKIRDEDHPRKWQDIILCHYPVAEWNKAHHGSWHLYGHTHGNSWYDRKFQPKYKCKNVGAPCVNYTPISYLELKKEFKNRELIKHHEE
jgi:calcineurin-like phosphoesterase family protein